MADNNVADLPKRNAVAAEPAKSLAATVQQVLSKAVTSPTDAGSDFAQGVKPVTGDAHQKSAGAADSKPTLKAEVEKEDEKEVKETSHEDEKKDEVKKEGYGSKKEQAEKEDDKEEVKEGEMPQAALDALKKKQDAKEEYGKDDEKKKDMKEASDEEEKEDEEEEEEKKESYHNKKDVKEAEEKEDEKEVKKETAHDKVKNMDMKEDVDALTEGENLSEEFKAKAATIFESAVKAKLVEEIEKLESEYETKVNEQVASIKEEIVEKVDAYLGYVVNEWMKENELAIEKGLRNEITEDFIGGLKSLFESHYIDVPQEKYNVIDEQASEIESLKSKLNESIEKNVELNAKIGEFAREDILQDVASDLAATEVEKFKGLAESIEYKDAADFRKKCETIKESYFPRKKVVSEESNDVAGKPDYSNLSDSMAAYAAAISKTKSNPFKK
jgi:hypothetical protein